jgi:nitrite reductase (NO-forming)
MHARTRRGLVQSTGFVLAAVAAALWGVGGGWWVGLHLFTVGGLLGAIVTVAPMLAVTWSAAVPPARWLAESSRLAVGVGAIAMALGRAIDEPWLAALGGLSATVAVVGLGTQLLAVRRSAATPRFAPAIEAYLLAVAAGVAGSVLGALLAAGAVGERWAALRSAHLTLNVFGLVGIVIAGTLPFFAATQLRTVMSSRAAPRRLRATNAVLGVGTAIAAIGGALGNDAARSTGLLVYAVALSAVASMLPLPTGSRRAWAGPRVLQLAAGLLVWVLAALALAFVDPSGGGDRVILRTLLIGGVAPILLASLAYLGPVVRGGGHRRLAAGFRVTASWVSVVAGSVATVASAADRITVLAAAVAVWALDLAIRGGRLVRRGATA